MAEQNELDVVKAQNEDLVIYIQDYQQQLVEAQFQAVQQRGLLRKAEGRIAELETELDLTRTGPASGKK